MNYKDLNTAMREAYHNKGIRGENIVFALLDTLSPNGYDSEGHGTFIAGQLREGCPNAEIMPINVFMDGGRMYEIIAAMKEVLARAKADPKRQYIVNMSLTWNGDVPDAHYAIQALVDYGIPVIVAAGNDGKNNLDYFPSNYYEPVCVSALNDDGTKAGFSTWHNEVDFSDWGNNVTVNGQTMSGTSMAAPQVAWKAGLLADQYIKAHGKKPTEEQIYQILLDSAKDLGTSGKDPYFGYGFLEIEVKEENEVVDVDREKLINLVLKNAESMLGTDYSKTYRYRIWPGGSADCSSLVGACWAAAGFPLMTDGKETQWTSMYEVYADGFDLIYPASKSDIGKKLPSTSGLLASCAKTGDIVFYNFDTDTTRPNKITHVAIVYDKSHIIHTANNTEKCCIKPISYGDGHICAVIRLMADATPQTFPELRKGSQEKWATRSLQAALNMRYGCKLLVDGDFGSLTEAALQGVTGSTICTKETWDTIFQNEPEPVQRDLMLTSPYMRGDDVKALQTVLKNLGYDIGAAGADGIYGGDTDKAVRLFQDRAAKLTAGVCDAAMRALLGV